tara:strand:- start:1114 stop:1245 length:132 start_codon:yes stop_codon:yes gene_type:complete
MEWSKEELETPLNEEASSASKEGNVLFAVFLIIITIGVLYYMI